MIKLLILDVDGCMTDGKIIYGSDGTEYKNFDVKDGMAIVSWSRLGFKSAIITGRNSNLVQRRADELNITYVYQGVKDKKAILDKILQKENIAYSEVAAIGDDLNDYNLLKSVGWSFAPQNAVKMVKKSVKTVLDAKGGNGAIREMLIKIVEKNNLTKEFTRLWL